MGTMCTGNLKMDMTNMGVRNLGVRTTPTEELLTV